MIPRIAYLSDCFHEVNGVALTSRELDAFARRRGCDTRLFRPREQGLKPQVVLGFTGRLTAEKNLRFLATLQGKLDAAYPGLCRFLIVGDGSERAWLEANLKNAHFTGVLKGEALVEAYASMDVFVFPSETDTYGNVVVEAMASGVPAVVSPKGGPGYLVRHGETGFVASSPDSYLEHVSLLARNLPLRMAMGRSGAALRPSAILECRLRAGLTCLRRGYRTAAKRQRLPRIRAYSGVFIPAILMGAGRKSNLRSIGRPDRVVRTKTRSRLLYPEETSTT